MGKKGRKKKKKNKFKLNNPMKKKTVLVGVYGTLRQGGINHRLLENYPKVGTITSLPKFTMYSVNGAYPGVVKGGHHSILIEIYRIPEEALDRLDRLERYHGKESETNLYNRELVETAYGNVYMYFYNNRTDRYPVVGSGDWMDFIKTSRATRAKILQAAD